MKEEWIAPYGQNIVFDLPLIKESGKFNGMASFIRFPGATSCTQELSVAFTFAFSKDAADDMMPTIFIISVKNYDVPAGMRLNNEAYTAYPSEGELVMPADTRVFILDIQRNYRIKNNNPSFAKYNGRSINIIQCYIG